MTNNFNDQMDYFIRRFDEDFLTLTKQKTDSKIIQMAHIPLHEVYKRRLDKIREYTNQASRERYLAKDESEVILANLIMKVLMETEQEFGSETDDFFDELASSKDAELDEILSGFEFYDNNPFREIAERRLEKIKRKKNK